MRLCPRQHGLSGGEGAGTNRDTWEAFMSAWASVVPPGVGGCRGGSGSTTLLSQGGQVAGPQGRSAGCSWAEPERVPWDELRGHVTHPAAQEGEQRAPPVPASASSPLLL